MSLEEVSPCDWYIANCLIKKRQRWVALSRTLQNSNTFTNFLPLQYRNLRPEPAHSGCEQLRRKPWGASAVISKYAFSEMWLFDIPRALHLVRRVVSFFVATFVVDCGAQGWQLSSRSTGGVSMTKPQASSTSLVSCLADWINPCPCRLRKFRLATGTSQTV